MTTRTNRIALELQALGFKTKVTAQISDQEDGEIELLGTPFSVQVCDDGHLILVEDVSQKDEFLLSFGTERRTVQQIYQDYRKATKKDLN